MTLQQAREIREKELKNLEQQILLVKGAIAQIDEILAEERQAEQEKRDKLAAMYREALNGGDNARGCDERTAEPEAGAQLQHAKTDGPTVD